jgi:putative oxygen-independent coproporphyrinogen III oxidase
MSFSNLPPNAKQPGVQPENLMLSRSKCRTFIPLGLYIHWPFCARKCPYCDFNVHVRAEIDIKRWLVALEREMARFAALTQGRRLESIFFGGGTPSLMPPALIASLVSRAQQHWPWSCDIEITLEANPGSTTLEHLQSWHAAGINRLSLGIQSLDEKSLLQLGRQHGREEAIAALKAAKRVFRRYNFDLIYARPEQDLPGWKAELEEALSYSGGHVSLYQLTIEPSTAFGAQVRRGDWRPLDEDRAADLFEATQDWMKDAGLAAYEISNHAQKGEESRHNLLYWHYADYIGIGPGAHGRLWIDGKKWAFRQHRAPEIWLKRVESDAEACTEHYSLSWQEAGIEALSMGLRLTEGIDVSRFAWHSGALLEGLIDAKARTRLTLQGLLEDDPQHLRATSRGRQILNRVLKELLPE